VKEKPVKKMTATLVAFFVALSLPLAATPERYRMISDDLLGFQDGKCVVIQTVYDNQGRYDGGISEQYYLEKAVSMNSVEVTKQIKISPERPLAGILAECLKPSFVAALPVDSDDGYLSFEIKDQAYLKSGYGYLNLSKYVQEELAGCRFIRVVDRYQNGPTFYFLIEMSRVDRSEYYRKVVAIPDEHYGP
jgi:hypothetical protein